MDTNILWNLGILNDREVEVVIAEVIGLQVNLEKVFKIL